MEWLADMRLRRIIQLVVRDVETSTLSAARAREATTVMTWTKLTNEPYM